MKFRQRKHLLYFLLCLGSILFFHRVSMATNEFPNSSPGIPITPPGISVPRPGINPGITLKPDLRIVRGTLSFHPKTASVGEKITVEAQVENMDTNVHKKVRVRFVCGKQKKDIFIFLRKKEKKRVKTSFSLQGPSGVQEVSIEINPVHRELDERDFRNNKSRKRIVVEKKQTLKPVPVAPGLQPPGHTIIIEDRFPELFDVQPYQLSPGQQYTLRLKGKRLSAARKFDFGRGIRVVGSLVSRVTGSGKIYMLTVKVAEKASPGTHHITISYKGKKKQQRPTVTVTTKNIPMTISSVSPSPLTQGKQYLLKIIGKGFPKKVSVTFDNGIKAIGRLKRNNDHTAQVKVEVAQFARPGKHKLTLQGKVDNTMRMLALPDMQANGYFEVIRQKSKPEPKTPVAPKISLSRITPSPLQQGKAYLLNILGNNFPQKMKISFDRGINATGKLRVVNERKAIVKVDVADNARIGRHEVILQDTTGQMAATVALPARKIRGSVAVERAPFTAPKVKPGPPVFTRKVVLTSLHPDRWIAGSEYKVSALGTSLDAVSGISFGRGVSVSDFKHQGKNRITFTVEVDDDVRREVRFATLEQGRQTQPTRVPAWILESLKRVDIPDLTWPDVTDEIAIRKGAIYLQNPVWHKYGDMMDGTHPVPILNDATVFNWREQIPGLADRFEVQFLTPKGTLLFAKEIYLGDPAMNITSFKPDSKFIMELFKSVTSGVPVASSLHSLNKNQHIQEQSFDILQEQQGTRSRKTVDFGVGSMSVSTTELEEFLSMLPPVFRPDVPGKGGEKEHLSFKEKYYKEHKRDIDLVWQVVGYKTFKTASGKTKKQPENGKFTLRKPMKTTILVASAESSTNIATEEVQVEQSEQWPLQLPDKWPGGVSCDQDKEFDLTVEFSRPKEWGMDTDLNHYPGDTVYLRADTGISIAHSPWAVSADTKYNNTTNEQNDGFPVIKDGTYSFNNIVIDWGDGSWQPLDGEAVLPREGSQQFNPPGWDSSDSFTFTANHKYDRPGKFPIRMYVVPQDQMNKIDQIAAAHQYVAPEQTSAAGKESDGKNASQKNSLVGNMEMVDSRIFLLYCNPYTVTIIQDTVATGPLHLDSVEIVSFSSDDSLSDTLQQQMSPAGLSAASKSGISAGLKSDKSINKTIPALSMNSETQRLSQINLPEDDTTVSTCEGGLWGRGRLRYYGAGYARIKWLIDNVEVKSRDIKIGPSELRTDLKSPDKSTWGDPILSDFMLDSPRMPVTEIGRHTVRITAEVIGDPTWSMVNAVSLQDVTGGGSFTVKGKALPPTTEDGIQAAFVPSAGTVSKKWSKQSKSMMQWLAEATDTNMTGCDDIVDKGGYAVQSPVKHYKVIENTSDMPCRFFFPVKEGEFEVIGLKHLKADGNSYTGDGKFIYKLPDGPSSASEHYTPISFTSWQADSNGKITSGTLKADTSQELNELPGMKAGLTRLDGIAGDHVNATMDVEIADTTIRLIGVEKPQIWTGAVSPLTPDGDWYATGLSLGESLIGWSMSSIESKDVRLDLSRKAGDAPLGTYGGSEWVGINLGKAVLHPYMFDLADIPINVDGWNITSDGLNGQAKTGGFSNVFGEGSIGWSNLDIFAFHSSISAKYKDFFVEMAWPKIRLEGKNTHYSYSPGSQVDVQLGLDGDLPVFHENYDHVEMTVTPKSFQHYNNGWGLMTDTEFSFRDEQGGLFADKIIANDLLFSIHGTAEYSGSSIPLNIKSQVGGADELISGVTLTTGNSGDRKLSFDFTSELSMEGIGRAESPVHILYGINRVTNRKAWDVGPDHPAEIVLRSHFPETNEAASSEFRVKYQHGKSQVACRQRQRQLLYAANYNYSSVMSDAWPPFPLVAMTGSISGGGCGNDTFGGTVDTHMFGDSSPAITGTFRFGEQNGARYWLGFLMGDNLHVPVYTGIFIEMIQGGLAYNFDHDAFRQNNGFDACPTPGKGTLFSAGLGVSVGGTDVIKADGVLTIQPSDSFYEMLLHANLFDTADLKGRLRYYQSAFDGEIWGNMSLIENKIYLEAKEHSTGVHIDSANWFFHAGTKAKMITGHVLMLDGGVYLGLGNHEGFMAGAMYKTGFDKRARGFGIAAQANFLGAVEIGLNPFNFDGRIDGHLSGKFINPIKDIGLGLDASVWLGCCHPPKFGFGFGLSCCCVKAGADIDVLPSPGFSPWAKWNCYPW